MLKNLAIATVVASLIPALCFGFFSYNLTAPDFYACAVVTAFVFGFVFCALNEGE